VTVAEPPLTIVHTAPGILEGFGRRFAPEIQTTTGIDAPIDFQIAGATVDLDRSRAIIAMGSPLMMNTPQTEWTGELSTQLVAAARAGVPVFGICFSHQMLAQHFGGSLARWDYEHEGIVDVVFRDEGPFAGIGKAPVVLTHSDRVTALGPDCIDLAHGGFGGIQAMRHRTLPMWTMQGHPECSDAMFADIEARGITHAFRRYTFDAREDPTGHRILAAFGTLVRRLESQTAWNP